MVKKSVFKSITSIAMSMAMVVSLLPGDSIVKTYAADSYDANGRYVSDIPVEKVEGLSKDFCMGADVSSAQALIDAGVRYVNIDGEEQDLYQLMADAGINYVRLRLWNDPYVEGATEKTVLNSYGAGICDIEYVKSMALAANDAGLKVLLDFHYSDFWADPAKQTRPKAWKSLEPDEVIQNMYDFTYDSLDTLRKAGADNITMVQIGNETTSQICSFGIHSENGYKAFASGCNAVRKFNEDNNTNIKRVIHFANPGKINFYSNAERFIDNNVDFDIFASSLYPEYKEHCSIESVGENLAEVRKLINPKTNKNIDVMIAEVGYRYTAQGEDFFGMYAKYGQGENAMAIFLRDLIAKINEIGGIGVFYWEPAWVDVGLDYNRTGTGWASDNALAYDEGMKKDKEKNPETGGKGGPCATSPLALFKATGEGTKIKAMEALNVYKYVYKGTTSANEVKKVNPVEIQINVGSAVKMPEKVSVTMKSLLDIDKSVTWNASDVSKIDNSKEGEYFVEGTIDEYNLKISALVEVGNFNYVKVDDVNVYILLGRTFELPAKVNGILNGGKKKTIKVNWNQDDVNTVNTNVQGTYVVNGTDADGAYEGNIHAYVMVAPEPDDSAEELVKNGSFEEPDIQNTRVVDNWTLEASVGNSDTKPIYTENNGDAVDGKRKLSIWANTYNNYLAEAYQEVDISKYGSGYYYISAFEQGTIDDIILYAKDGDANNDIKKSVGLKKIETFNKSEMIVYINNSSKLTVGVLASDVKTNEWTNFDLVSVKYCGKGQNLTGKALLDYSVNSLEKDINANNVIQNNNSLTDAVNEAKVLSDTASEDEVNTALSNIENAASESFFKISSVNNEGGTVSIDADKAKTGTTVKVTATPLDERYSVKEIKVFDINNRLVEVNKNSFVMPQSSVTIQVEFEMSEDYYISSTFRTYHKGDAKLLITFSKQISELSSKYYGEVSGRYAYYMDDDKAYGENWYKFKIKKSYGKFDVYKVENDNLEKIYTCNNNTSDYDNILVGSTPLLYDGYLYADVNALMKEVNKVMYTFYIYGAGRKELSLRFGNSIKSKNANFTINGWPGIFYVMDSAKDEYGDGWFKMKFADIDGGFQIVDSSKGHDENSLQMYINFGFEDGIDLYEQVLAGKTYYVIADGKLYSSIVETGKYLMGSLDKPVVKCSKSTKEATYNVSWSKVANATEYEIQVDGNTIANVDENTTSYEVKAPYAGSNGVSVIAKANGYDNGMSEIETVYVSDNVFSAKVVRTSVTKAKLSWVFSPDGEGDGYEIYAKKGNGSYSKIATKGISVNSLDVNVDNTNTYTFKVVPYADNNFGKVYGKSKTCILKPEKVITTGPKVSSVLNDGTYKYKVTKVAKSDGTVGEVAIKGALKKTIKSVKIADVVKIGGYSYKVTSIGNNAFKKYKKLTSVSIGANVKTIGSNAFNGCKKLKSIKINSIVITKMGKASFKGIKKKAKFKVPKAKKKAYKKMIKKSSAKKPIIK